MALDFAVLTEDRTAIDQLSLGRRQHEVLMTLAAQLRLRHLLRFADYLEEIEFRPSELPALARDLDIVSKSAAPREIVTFARALDGLVTLAIQRHKPLMAIPD
jgi:sulfur carrier protein ThiS